MKTSILLLLLILTSCSKDSSGNSISLLPPETQTGANTFGVTINGKVYVPRDPTGFNVGPSGKGMVFWASPGSTDWDELEVKDGKSAVGFQMFIHIQNLKTLGVQQYVLKQSNFQNGIDSVSFSNIYFKIWDSAINNYAYYGSIEDQGEINVTRNDTINFITSGNFKGKFVRYDNPNNFIIITDGRFDIGPGLHNTIFP
ncbi:hypothetical protein [Flavobacterium sp.]|uniref:hypothetical protein n=1 Tax=Flavobacterium sp. TaxID=239 RepID=UPI0037538F90